MKTCTTCGASKPEDRFNIDKRRGSLRSICKDCYNDKAKALRSKRKAVTTDEAWSGDGSKVCNCCGVDKPVAEFSKDRRIAGKYRHNCKACEAENLRKWREDNPDLYEEHYKGRAKAKPGYYNFFTARRRTMIARARPEWALDEFQAFAIGEAYELAKLREMKCGQRWEVDHFFPIVSKDVCGLHVIENLQVIPKIINQAKSNKFIAEVRHGFFQ